MEFITSAFTTPYCEMTMLKSFVVVVPFILFYAIFIGVLHWINNR
jgi:cytochrome bd-type quinol oxidase subunit 2